MPCFGVSGVLGLCRATKEEYEASWYFQNKGEMMEKQMSRTREDHMETYIEVL